MKKLLLIIFIILPVMVMMSCNEGRPKRETTLGLITEFGLYIRIDAYESVKRLFFDQNTLTYDKYKYLQDKYNDIDSTSGTTSGGINEFELLSFGNGDMLLMEVVKYPDTGEYYIKDLFFVPDEVKKFLKDNFKIE